MANVVISIALAGGFAFATTPAHVALRWLLRSLVRTTATVGRKSKFGRITALVLGSLLYGIRNYIGIGGFCSGGNVF